MAEIDKASPWAGEYHVAVFTPDGALEGTGKQRVSDLSKKWIGVCTQMLIALGPKFRAPLAGPLPHFEVALTSAKGSGIGTFYVNRKIALSTLYLSGQSPTAEADLREMFLASLRRAVKASTEHPAFGALANVGERPLYVVVVWANPAVAANDYELLHEFSTHFAAALFEVMGCADERSIGVPDDHKSNREYRTFDPNFGYPTGPDLFYECLRCGRVLGSRPVDSTSCDCRNIYVDVDYGRIAIRDVVQARLFARVD